MWDPMEGLVEACVSLFMTTIDVEKKCERRCKDQVLWQREPLAYLVPFNGTKLHLAI